MALIEKLSEMETELREVSYDLLPEKVKDYRRRYVAQFVREAMWSLSNATEIISEIIREEE